MPLILKKENPKVVDDFRYKPTPLIRPMSGFIKKGNVIYSSWSGQYGKMESGLLAFDLKTKKTNIISTSILGKGIGDIATDGKYLYGVTSNKFNGVKDSKKIKYFWVFDTEKQNLKTQIPLKNLASSIKVFSDSKNNIWIADELGVKLFDKKEEKFTTTISWPVGTLGYKIKDYDISDNQFYCSIKNQIIKIDLINGYGSIIHSTESVINTLAVDAKANKLYFGENKSLFEIEFTN